jgi:hypothetical protein
VARFPRPAEGTWTEHHPELGTGLVSFEDSISPEFYALEREAIFKRAWLNVGRMEQLPRNRGNKLLWEGTPRGEISGNARQFVCKYHGWRYGLDGACTYVHQQSEFFGLRKDELEGRFRSMLADFDFAAGV